MKHSYHKLKKDEINLDIMQNNIYHYAILIYATYL